MIASSTFKDQTIFVLGLGKSGRSVALSLLKAGARVLVWDDQIDARNAASNQGIPIADLNHLNWKSVNHFILSPGIPHRYPMPHPLVLEAQKVALQPISDLEVFYRTHPQGCYIGITGTNGKSTTTSLLGHILRESDIPVAVGGNLGIPVMDLDLLPEDGIYVWELSSYQLEISPSLHFNIGILLNITPDHLDRHGGMEGYIEAKKLIYKNATPTDNLVMSVDDPHCLKIYDTLKISGKVPVLPISVGKVLPDGVYVKEGILYEKAHPIVNLNQYEHLKGQHNWQNVAATYGALRVLGLSPDTIISGISSFPGLAHRQQVVTRHKNVLFVNDSKATNGEAVEKVLACYQGSPIYWLLGGRPKEGGIESLTPYFSTIKHAFLFGEASPVFAHTLEGKVPFTLCETLAEAVKKASQLAFKDQLENAIVLLSPACASFDQFKDFEERGDVFCKTVKKIINGK